MSGPPDPPEKQTFRWFAAPYDFMRECREKYGDTFTLRFAEYGEHLCVSHPDAVREVFTAPPGVLEAGAGNDPLRPLLGDLSLLLLDGAEHRHHRKILTPAFSEDRIAAFRSKIEAIAGAAFSEWRDIVPVHPTMVRISLEVILEFVLGNARLLPAFTALLQRPSLSLKLFAGDPIKREIDDAIYAQIRSGSREGVLDLLRGEEEQAIRDELVTLIVAGHETTASSLAWAVWLALSSGVTSPIEGVCREALRMRPVIPVVSRRVAQPISIGGHAIEPGKHVMPCIYLTHHREEIYPEPDRFLPSRFERKYSPYEYLPFGGGARRCIGMAFALFEMEIVLSHLFSRFQMELVDRDPPRPIRSALMIVPSGGVRVRVQA